jgi:putative colanic acid biosynthesis UDP-glucose lipid carrier transferase
MHRLSTRAAIHTPQQPLSLIARVADSIGIVLSLYLSTLLADSVELGWTRVHGFYAMMAIMLMQFYSEFFNVYQNWKIKNNLWTRLWMVSLAGLAWASTGLTLFLVAIIFDQAAHMLDWKLATYWFFLSIITFGIARFIINFLMRTLRRSGINVRRIAVVGAGPIGRHVHEQIEENPWVGYEIVNVYDDRSHKEYHFERVTNRRKREEVGNLLQGLPVNGDFNMLEKDALENRFDAVFIALPMRAEHKIQEIIRQLSWSTVAVYVVPDFYSIETHFTHMVDINGMPAVSVYENPVSGLRGVVKRGEDVILSMLILLIIALPMLLIAIGIKLTSKGPVFFRQTRYGLGGKPIKVWKFRTMKVTEEGDQFVQATRDDPRITQFGAFLRKTSLDELPQFFNVLSGTMSIVGPRPHAVAHNEAYRNIIRGYMLRHKTKPGITGWAQVNGLRGETDSLDKMRNRVMYDIDYIRKWSILFDLKIIALTILKGFTGKNAY